MADMPLPQYAAENAPPVDYLAVVRSLEGKGYASGYITSIAVTGILQQLTRIADMMAADQVREHGQPGT